MLNLLAVAIRRIIDRYSKLVFAVLFALLFFHVRVENIVFCLSTRGIVFFSLGYYCVKYKIHLTALDKIRFIPFNLIFAVAILLACFLRNTPCEYLTILLVIFVGGGYLFRFGTRFKCAGLKRRVLWMTQFSFSIYLFHQMYMMMIQKVAARFLPINPYTQSLAYFGIPIFMISFCVLFSIACKAKLPKLYTLLTGNR